MNIRYRKIAEEIGVLVGTTGVVSLFLVPMKVDGILTSILSLFVFCTLLVFFHSSFINSRIKSSHLGFSIVLLIFLSIYIIYITRTESPFKEKIEKSNDFLGERLGHRIKSAKTSIWFIGQSFHISAPDRHQELIEKVKKGINVYYIVVDFSDSCLLSKIFDDYSPNTSISSKSEMISSLADIITLKRECDHINSDDKGKVQIKFLTTFPYYRGYFFDIEAEYKTAYIVPYLNHFPSSEVAGYLFEGFDYKSIAYKYYESLKRSWSRGQLLTTEYEERILNLKTN